MDDIETILAERQTTHGDWETHAWVTQSLKNVVTEFGDKKLTPGQKEALDMILHKIGRIVAGNPNHEDHWIDIAGYATLEARRLH